MSGINPVEQSKGDARGFTPPLTPPHHHAEGVSSTRREGDRSASAASRDGLDAHPVVRQHFGRRLKEGAPDAFREANRRLYEHYKALPQKLYGKELPDTLEEMQPLFAAIAHGCAAGLHQEVFDEVLWVRVFRRNEYFILHKMGNYNAALGALAHFFGPPWGRPHSSLTPTDQAVALAQAAFALRPLGRLREAVETTRATVRLFLNREEPNEYSWRQAEAAASNLSELLLLLGEVGPAVATARESVEYAHRSKDLFRLLTNQVRLGDALHQSGNFEESEALFRQPNGRKMRTYQIPFSTASMAFNIASSYWIGSFTARFRSVLNGLSQGFRTC